MKVTVKDRQTLADLALQHQGSITALLDIAELNGIGITDRLTNGREMDVADSIIGSATVRRYQVKNIEPATELSEEELSSLAQEGINFMGIEIDFNIA